MKIFAVIAGTFVAEGKPSREEIFKMPDSYFEGELLASIVFVAL